MIKKFSCLILLLLCINCSSTNKDTGAISDEIILDNPENLYKIARLTFDQQEYELARQQFSEIKKLFPLSNEAIQSEIMIAFISYIQMDYDNAILKVYNVPVFYFPKFFHPDPTVKRQSGFLQPRINNSNILGSSISIPYYYAISEDKDVTINPILFSKNTKMFQNEFRQKKEDSFLIADFGIVNNFKSSN